MKRILLSAPLILTLLAACGQEGPATSAPADTAAPVEASVQVTDVWCRPSPNGAVNGACYVTLSAAKADRLMSVSSPAAQSVELHDMTMEGGMMRMSALPEGVPLQAGATVVLAPGGKHIMLMGLTQPLALDARVPLTFSFEGAPQTTVEAVVRQPPLPGADHGAAGH